MADETATNASPSTPRKATEKEAMFFLAILGAMKNKPDVCLEILFQYSETTTWRHFTFKSQYISL